MFAIIVFNLKLQHCTMAIVKQWRDAASLILVSRAFINGNNIGGNFKVLALKRSDRTSFMPGSYVFPGGVVDSADSNENWLDLFKRFGFNTDLLPTTSFTSKCPLLDDETNLVPKSVSTRIAAIRETFEESGVLLCKHSSSVKSEWLSYLAGYEIQKWQNIVQNDPCKFIDLCNHFECFPDIWSLHLWSNWLTPIQHKKRFDTAFFIASCDELPPVYIDNTEIVEFKWHTPHDLLGLCSTGDILLPPPQYYELSRIKQFTEIEQLHECAVYTNTLSCERWMPVQIKTAKGLLSLLPGDYMYPANPDNRSGDLQTFEGNMSDLGNKDETLHRIELRSSSDIRIVVQNLQPTSVSNGVLPWTSQNEDNN